ncbi:Translation initiation factor IF2/IF5 [Trypanosoma melophagium]|uniref:Translation initiation factor IF2/IF5 n=1 Tax=Trypanosoma melophagium TaxID=715481 RepID=UPI003519ED9C|nr:Translation initiation factor IF2/IF5 [Trypanosoma melophagium]
MSVAMIPIDPEKRDDIYYRYKMPAIQTKVEGSGNGIKTVFPNIHDVCLAINRPEAILMKFFQSEIGAQRTVLEKDDKFLIMGSHTEERVQEKVYDFVRKFVLCRHCRNPETQLFVERSKKNSSPISLSCGACGKVMKLMDLDPRYVTALVTYYAKNPQSVHKKGAGTAETRGGDNKEAAAAAGPTGGRAVIQKSDLEDTREPPQDILARCMREHAGEPEEIMRCCMELMSSYNLKEKMGPLLVLNAIIMAENEFMAGLRRHSNLLKRFSTVSEAVMLGGAVDEAVKTTLMKRENQLQNATIDECARLCSKRLKPDQLVVILFVLFTEGVLKDTSITEWCLNATPVSKLDPKLEAEMKEKSKPFFEWLNAGDLKENAAS